MPRVNYARERRAARSFLPKPVFLIRRTRYYRLTGIFLELSLASWKLACAKRNGRLEVARWRGNQSIRSPLYLPSNRAYLPDPVHFVLYPASDKTRSALHRTFTDFPTRSAFSFKYRTGNAVKFTGAKISRVSVSRVRADLNFVCATKNVAVLRPLVQPYHPLFILSLGPFSSTDRPLESKARSSETLAGDSYPASSGKG